MGAVMAKAMGNRVTVISTSDRKEQMAKEMGVDRFIVSKNTQSMASAKKSLNIILNTIGADHELSPFLDLLKKKGTMVVLGIVSAPFKASHKVFKISIQHVLSLFARLTLPSWSATRSGSPAVTPAA